MESCVEQWATELGRQKLTEAGKDIRCGWCLGDADFREMVLERIEQVMKTGMPSSYSGEEVRRHDEVAAERSLQEALALFRLSESALGGMRKGADVKRVLAWALRKRTTVSNRWLSAKLGLGHPANVPGYLRSVENANAGRLFHLRRQIEKTLISED